MKKFTLSLFSLKKSSHLNVASETTDITSFVYELFSSFNNSINESENSIMLNPIQQNTDNLKNKIKQLVEKYSSIIPQINNLNSFLKILAPNEYFYTIVLEKELPTKEIYNLYQSLLKLNNPSFDLKTSIDQGNELFKDVWDNYSIITHDNGKKTKLGEIDKNKRVCRFCGKSVSEGATFNKIAHSISEALGNKTLVFNEECDICNEYFGKDIENALITYLNVFRIFFGILNKKNEIPKIKGKNFEYFNDGNKSLYLKFIDDNSSNTNPASPLTDIPLIFFEKIRFQNIYKALVKFALSSLEQIDKIKFSKTIKWLRNDIFEKKLPKIGILADYHFFKKEPSIIVYLRKNDNKRLPYAVGEFHFTFLTYVFIIPTFDDEKTFLDNEDFSFFWKTFKHYDLVKKFKFENFSDSEERNIQFNFKFENANNNYA